MGANPSLSRAVPFLTKKMEKRTSFQSQIHCSNTVTRAAMLLRLKQIVMLKTITIGTLIGHVLLEHSLMSCEKLKQIEPVRPTIVIKI